MTSIPMNPTEPPNSSNPSTSSSAWPDEQALLMYLMEPELLAPDELAALISWLSASPEHADRLGELASQVCAIADHVQSLPTPTEPVVPPEQTFESNTLVLVSHRRRDRAGGYVVVHRSHRNLAGLNDDVAIAWATNHDSLAISDTELWDSELWTNQDLELMSELSISDRVDTHIDMALEEPMTLEEGEQAIGFTDSEPPSGW